jgi:hypothetical protein
MVRIPGRLALLPLLVTALAASPLPAPASAVPGAPSVTVQSLTGNPETTTSIAVHLLLTWPAGAEQVTVTNGDGAFATYAVVDSLDWQLTPVPAKTAAQIKTVTTTYTGTAIASVTVTDSILLDVQGPRLPEQRLYQNGKGWFLAAQVEDRGAGVASIALLGRTGAPITSTVVCADPLCPAVATEAFFLKRARPRLARLTDAAGNAKVVALVRRATRCSVADGSYPVFTLGSGYYDCVQGGDRCRPDDGHFWHPSAYVRCRLVHGRNVVVVVLKGA